MRTLLLGLPLKQAEAILGEAGISPQVRVTDAPRREKRRMANIARRFRIGRRKTARCREIFLTRFPIRNRKQTDTAGFVGRGALRCPPFRYREKTERWQAALGWPREDKDGSSWPK